MDRRVHRWWLMVVLLFVGSAVGCLGPKTSPVPITPPIEESPVPGATAVATATAEPTRALPCNKCDESPFMWPVADGLFKWAFRDKGVCAWPCIPAFGHQGIDIYPPNPNAAPNTVPVYAVADGEVVDANTYSLRLKVSMPEAFWDRLNSYNAIDPDEKHAFGPGRNQVHVYYTHMANRSCDISYVDLKFRSGELPIKVKQGELLGRMGLCGGLEPGDMHLHISVNRLREDSRDCPYKEETEEGSTPEYDPKCSDHHSYDPTPYFGMALHMNHLPRFYPAGTSQGVSHTCNYEPETWVDKMIPSQPVWQIGEFDESLDEFESGYDEFSSTVDYTIPSDWATRSRWNDFPPGQQAWKTDDTNPYNCNVIQLHFEAVAGEYILTIGQLRTYHSEVVPVLLDGNLEGEFRTDTGGHRRHVISLTIDEPGNHTITLFRFTSGYGYRIDAIRLEAKE